MREHFLWTEKYRPKKIDDILIPEKIKDTLKGFIKKENIPDCLFYSTTGTSKTTAAKAIAYELGADFLFINASEESGVDVLRNKIRQFASTVSFGNKKIKIIILDEFDRVSPNFYDAMRGMMEEFARSTRWIATCNHVHKIPDAIRSRFQGQVNFNFTPKDRKYIFKNIYVRMAEILKKENIEFDKDILAKICKDKFPDVRSTLNKLQLLGNSGRIDKDSYEIYNDKANFDNIIKYLRKKDWGSLRKLVAESFNNNSEYYYRQLFDSVTDIVKPKYISEAILIIGDYNYKDALVVDKEINLMTCFTHLMESCEFKD